MAHLSFVVWAAHDVVQLHMIWAGLQPDCVAFVDQRLEMDSAWASACTLPAIVSLLLLLLTCCSLIRHHSQGYSDLILLQ